MSTPINHHYVSQCQIKNFFNQEEGAIYLFDKEKKRFFERKSTKRVFSELESNTKLVEGKKDHETLEKDLRINFEDKFQEYYHEILKLLENPNSYQKKSEKALIELAKYGIAGEIRNPNKKKYNETRITNTLFNDILPHAAHPLKKELEKMKVFVESTKHINAVKFSEFAEYVFRAMGGINCIVYHITSGHKFILPDRASLTHREKINTYFNPDIREIAVVGVPLSDKVFLHAESAKLRNIGSRIVELTDNNTNIIFKLNCSLFANAYTQVACEDKEYLKEFVNRYNLKYFPDINPNEIKYPDFKEIMNYK